MPLRRRAACWLLLLLIGASYGRLRTSAELRVWPQTQLGAPTLAEPPRVMAGCTPTRPGSCGQVRIDGDGLYDQHGPWVMHGVQFFLPAHGINGKSLWDANYAAALRDGSLAFWLDRAHTYLRANLLRVFADMPYAQAGATIIPTSPATLYDLAQQAEARGMRLGIVLSNDDSWTMTPARRAWIESLLAYFAERDGLGMIAYLNADNEINNHCDPAHRRDCLAFMPRAYLVGAVEWAKQVRTVVKARTPQMLLTVGMSTELDAAPGRGGARNYFLKGRQGDTLATLADFLAPHNYGGAGAGVLAVIRAAGYTPPVVLEEYGFPTDPATRDGRWREGPPICRTQPLAPECSGTAPFFVETNLNVLRGGGYAGGVAWMLADMQEKNTPRACDSPGVPSDLWTGLFSLGGSSCGGTAAGAIGAPKATAVRVCVYHTGTLALCEPPRGPSQP